MNAKKALILIFVFAVILRFIYAFLIPIYEKPDEVQHFEYIKYFSENKALPVIKENERGEFFQPPFYHFFASYILNLVKIFTRESWTLVVSMRILSIFISMFTLFFVYKIASLLFKDTKLTLAITAFGSFLPSNINMNSAVTNANFGDLLSTLVLYLILKILVKGSNKKDMPLIALFTGIGLLTRFNIVPALLIIPLALTLKYYPDIKEAIKSGVLIIAVIAVISGWYLIRNFMLYGDFLGIGALRLAHPPQDAAVDAIFFIRLVVWTFISFWASFGRTNGIFIGNLKSAAGITVFIIAYFTLAIITIMAVYGLFIFLKRYRENPEHKKAFAIISLHILLLALSLVLYSMYENFQPQGRLLFPAISTISIFFTVGLHSLIKKSQRHKFLCMYVISFIVLNIISILSIIHFFYIDQQLHL